MTPNIINTKFLNNMQKRLRLAETVEIPGDDAREIVRLALIGLAIEEALDALPEETK